MGAFEAEQMAIAPTGLSKGFVVENIFAAMFVNSWVARLFTQSAFNNVMLALGAACIVLFLATLNWRLAITAFCSILFVVVQILGMMKILGWKVGLIEAMCMALIVGFSVDYIVHLAHAHVADHDGKGTKRKERAYYALQTMGVSVIAGFATTFLASCVLMMTKLVFFNKFGIYICCTIVWALIVSLGIFSPLILIIGPEDDQGDFSWICFKKEGKQ